MADRSSLTPLFIPPPPPSPFIGRGPELEWLNQRIIPSRRLVANGVAVIGEAGIGKTALVAEAVQQTERAVSPVWFGHSNLGRNPPPLRQILDDLTVDRGRGRFVVVIDGFDAGSPRTAVEIYSTAMNRKNVSAVIITSRTEVPIRGIQSIHLERMAAVDFEALLREKLALSDIDENTSLRVLAAANGHPEALSMMTIMARSMSSEQLRRILSGDLYDIREQASEDARDVERAAKPVIVTVGNDLMKRLKKEPKEVHKLSPRQFEELIADLLRDMGYDVTLTKTTRDGGADILASIKNDLGKFLYLIDAKKYSEKNKIGVDMVRTLLGTLADYQASSAMLVTTSSFTKDARAMEKRHQWQLALHDYIIVAEWIQKHGNRRV
jgi:restriction system protein